MKMYSKILAAALTAFISLQAAAALEATVTSTNGKVQLQKGSSWVDLRTGDKVSGGAVISTGFNSSAKLNIEGSSVELGPLTRVTIEKLVSTSTKNESSLYLDSGKVSADVSKSSDKRTGFKVSTPVATASVRGTSFTIFADGRLHTHEGLVAKGLPESSAPKISDEPSSYEPAQGDTNAFTSVKDVSGSYGIPVYAGQISSTDSSTGLPTPPQRELAKSASDIGSDTISKTALEKIAPPMAAAPGAGEELPDAGEGALTGTIVITVSFASD